MLIIPIRTVVVARLCTMRLVLDATAARDARASFEAFDTQDTQDALNDLDALAAFAAQGDSNAQAAYDGRRFLVDRNPGT